MPTASAFNPLMIPPDRRDEPALFFAFARDRISISRRLSDWFPAKHRG